MDEKDLVVAYNDIDLCLKVMSEDLRIVWSPWAELYHRESASTGNRVTRPEERERTTREHRHLRKRWAAIVDADPYSTPNASIGDEKEKFGLAWPPHVSVPWEVRTQEGSLSIELPVR